MRIDAVICASCRGTLRARFASALVAVRMAQRFGWRGDGVVMRGTRLVVGMTCGGCRASETRTVRPNRENMH